MITWLGTTLVDVAHARALLTAWTNKPGNPKPLPGYGTFFPSVTWTAQDGVVLHAFAKWWNGAGYSPKLAEGVPVGNVVQAELTDAHVAALDKWAAGSVPLPSFVDVPASKALLALWSKTSGAGDSPVADYGMSPVDLSPTWTSRDGQVLAAFGAWWSKEEGASLSGTTLTAEHSLALKQWFAQQVQKVPAGWVAPPSQPKQPPLPTPPQPLPPLPAPGPEPPKPGTGTAAKSEDRTALYVLGGVFVLVVGGLWLFAASRGRAEQPPQDNPLQEYRGWKIEGPVDTTHLGYRTRRGDPGRGKKIRGYFLTGPDGATKFVSTLTQAHRYIDEYMGPLQDNSRLNRGRA